MTLRVYALRIEVYGHGWPPSLAPSLSSALSGAPHNLPASFLNEPRTVRIDVSPPRLSPYEAYGVTWRSCSLSATVRMTKGGPFADLGPLQVAGAYATDELACQLAAHKLADAVVTRIWNHPQED